MEKNRTQNDPTQVSHADDLADSGVYVAPEVLAARNGEQIDFGTTVVEREEPAVPADDA